MVSRVFRFLGGFLIVAVVLMMIGGLDFRRPVAAMADFLLSSGLPLTWPTFNSLLLLFLGMAIGWLFPAYRHGRVARQAFDRQKLQLEQEIGERRAAEAALRRAELQFRGLVESARAIVWRGDPATFQMTYVSPEAETLLGYPLSVWTSEPDFWQRHVHPKDRDWAIDYCARETEALRPHRFEYRMVAADGRVVWLYDVVELVVEAGIPKEMVGVMVDITERKRAETLLATEKGTLEMIAGGKPLTEILGFLCESIEEQIDDSCCSILLLDRDGHRLLHGAAPSLPADYIRAIDGIAIGPEVGSCGTAASRAEAVIVSDIATDPLWENFREAALAHGLRACWSTPIVTGEKEVLGTFAVYYRRPGRHPGSDEIEAVDRAAHLARICIERKRTEDRLKLYREIVFHSNDGIGITDLQGHYLEQNPAHRALIGYTDEQLAGETPKIHLGQHTFSKVTEVLQENGVYRGEIRSRRRDGTLVDIELAAFLVRDESGAPLAMAGIKRDITERKRAEARLRILAEKDFLTRIYNRRKFQQLLKREIERVKRYPRPLSLVLFDIDDFKKINDSLGHNAGDRVICTVAKVVAKNVRETDLFARYGGEEFVILAVDTETLDARILAEKLRAAIEKQDFGPAGRVTASFGVTEYWAGETIKEFFRRADVALYRAKRAGKNCVDVQLGSSSLPASD